MPKTTLRRVLSLLLVGMALLVSELNFVRPEPRAPLVSRGLGVSVVEASFQGQLITDGATSDLEFGITGLSEVTISFASGSSTSLPAAVWFDELGLSDPRSYTGFVVGKTEGAADGTSLEVSAISYACCGEDSQLVFQLRASSDFTAPEATVVTVRARVESGKLTCVHDDPKIFCPLSSVSKEQRAVLAIRDSNLIAADFTGLDLRHAVFLNVDLRGAVFVGADLTGALFRGCDLRGADFTASDQRHLLISNSKVSDAQGLSVASGSPRLP